MEDADSGRLYNWTRAELQPTSRPHQCKPRSEQPGRQRTPQGEVGIGLTVTMLASRGNGAAFDSYGRGPQQRGLAWGGNDPCSSAGSNRSSSTNASSAGSRVAVTFHTASQRRDIQRIAHEHLAVPRFKARWASAFESTEKPHSRTVGAGRARASFTR